MLSLILAAYLQAQVSACCRGAVQIPQFSGTACKDKASSETMVRLYAEHAPGDEATVRKMVSKTHQCARVVFGHPLYIVYWGMRVWGQNGMAEVRGLTTSPTLPTLMYVIMRPDGDTI